MLGRHLLMFAIVGLAAAFTPSQRQPHLARGQCIRQPLLAALPANEKGEYEYEVGVPPLDGMLDQPIPEFSWRRALFFCLNPAALVPIPLVAKLCGLNVLGAAFCMCRADLLHGALLATPLLLLSLLPLEELPAFSSLREVTTASKTITLYALGGAFRPLPALATAILISASAAVFEELAFRGVLQTLAQRGLSLLLPGQAAVAISVLAQAILFGVLHSYTPSPAYLITASLAGLALGGAFAASGSLLVPIVMHFLLDLVSFVVCHVQVVRGGTEQQRQLVVSGSPVAAALAASMASPLLAPRQ
eukprot:CAMPEP_0181229704 /NCGR_PEP_ID=MMETSP1096-20121128/34050_1 /TAXON_ID=156174 ORGANISM="Chrysochromulina ericina, Strain CCMP281" /NCGR_SAMPLE_ID=MMETSP1096 /ASSEMBLY_ACC=CAM_ASM_000453 /LENGTH=303 /DNA_ID=CAMNT_0023323367 /DNA_START=35 /DNA_END=946 /DNA_ORIENTATION=+